MADTEGTKHSKPISEPRKDGDRNINLSQFGRNTRVFGKNLILFGLAAVVGSVIVWQLVEHHINDTVNRCKTANMEPLGFGAVFWTWLFCFLAILFAFATWYFSRGATIKRGKQRQLHSEDVKAYVKRNHRYMAVCRIALVATGTLHYLLLIW